MVSIAGGKTGYPEGELFTDSVLLSDAKCVQRPRGSHTLREPQLRLYER